MLQGCTRRKRRHKDDKQRKRSKQARDAIEIFDRILGEVRPLIVIGYNMIGRCTSIRSKHRVITHIIGAYQQGRSKADAEQMLMRGNGKSREVGSISNVSAIIEMPTAKTVHEFSSSVHLACDQNGPAT